MAISDAEYAVWLAADNKERVMLVEVKAYSGGSEVTRYFSNRGFTSTPTDTPANTSYEDILRTVPQIRSLLAEVFTGKSFVSFGDLIVDNSSGVRDSWLTDSWDGRDVNLFLGDPSWPKSDFRTVFMGSVEDISAQDTRTLQIRIRDRQYLFEVPVSLNRVGGSGTTKDQRIPIAYGEVKNVQPVLIDAAARKYQWHDGQVQSVDAVYDNGVAIATYTADLTLGTISLTAAATGVITLDGKGSKTGGTYVNKIADIAQRIILERTVITSGSIDSATVSTLNTDAPGVAGVYFSRDNTTVLQALDEVLGKSGAYFTIDRVGKVSFGLFKAPAGTAVVSLTDDDYELGSLMLKRRIVPLKSVRVGYARFHTTGNYGTAAALTEAQRQRLSDDYLVAYQVTSGATGFAMAVDGDIAGTPYAASGDAATEATRRAALWGVLRRVFSLRGFLAPQQVKLGDVVSVDFSRYGLSGGVLARVVALSESTTNNRIDMDIFI